MSTNYYMIEQKYAACTRCGRDAETSSTHIGQFAGGWTFLVQVYENGPSTWDEWKRLLATHPSAYIEDEYGTTLALEELIGLVEHPTWQGRPRRSRGHDVTLVESRVDKGWESTFEEFL